MAPAFQHQPAADVEEELVRIELPEGEGVASADGSRQRADGFDEDNRAGRCERCAAFRLVVPPWSRTLPSATIVIFFARTAPSAVPKRV